MKRGFFNRQKVDEAVSKLPLNFLIIALAIIYTGFLLYQSIYFNYKLNKKVSALKKEILQLQEKQEQIKSLIAYYKTSSFQELEARRKLGLKMPGEKVIKVEVLKSNNQFDDSREGVSDDGGAMGQSNFDLWVRYIKGELDEN